LNERPSDRMLLNEHIAHMARDVVDSVIEKGQCDSVNDVAGALPS